MEWMKDRLRPQTWERLRSGKKKLDRAGLFARGVALSITRGSGGVQNVYHGCVQKTGSQWIKAVLSDPDIRKISGLRTHPQFRYESGSFKQHFPKYTFVPGLYVSYGLYNEIDKPPHYKTFYVIRDPRDIVVSWYYSMKYTHELMGTVPKHRKRLLQLNVSDGITYCIHELQLKLSFMRTWWNNQEDPRVYITRFEELTQEPISEWRKIFDHCEIEVGKSTLEAVLSRYTKEKMRERDSEGRENDRSHYRKEKKEWRDLFEEYHIELFSKVNGDLVERLGYE
jgi:hypothetical protein